MTVLVVEWMPEHVRYEAARHRLTPVECRPPFVERRWAGAGCALIGRLRLDAALSQGMVGMAVNEEVVMVAARALKASAERENVYMSLKRARLIAIPMLHALASEPAQPLVGRA